MAPKIYRSPYPDVSLSNCSVFSHLFYRKDASRVGEHPASDVAYVDAPTGTSLTRGQVRSFSLQLARSLRTHPALQARRGQTVMIYSQNSLTWPVALFGSGKLTADSYSRLMPALTLYVVAAGLKCTLANNAYNARELAFQYTDSGARIVFTSEEGIPVVLEMFKDLGISEAEAKKRTIVLTTSLNWAGGNHVPVSPAARGFTHFSDLLMGGVLASEERFDGELANETVYLCYSSGTTGKPKGVEVRTQFSSHLDVSTRPCFYDHVWLMVDVDHTPKRHVGAGYNPTRLSGG